MAIIEKLIRMKKKKGNDIIISYPQTVEDNILVDNKEKTLKIKHSEIDSQLTNMTNQIGTKIPISDIQDNLTSTAANKPLSANMGRVLNEDILQRTFLVSIEVHGSYNWFVILLHRIGTPTTNTRPSIMGVTQGWCIGKFIILKDYQASSNGVVLGISEVETVSTYTTNDNRARLEHIGAWSTRLVVVSYEGASYIALDVYGFTSQPQTIRFEGTTANLIKRNIDENSLKSVRYWSSGSNSVLHEEIYNSLTPVTESEYFNHAPYPKRFGSDLSPFIANAYSLGTNSQPWKQLHLAKAEWFDLTLQNGFEVFASYVLQYCKIGNIVFISGSVKHSSGTTPIGEIIATLPSGYRPVQAVFLSVPLSNINGGGFARLGIDIYGRLSFNIPSNQQAFNECAFLNCSFAI